MKGLLIALAVALLFAVAITAVQQIGLKTPPSRVVSAPVPTNPPPPPVAQPAPTSAEDALNAEQGKAFMNILNLLLNPQLPMPKPSDTSSGTQPPSNQGNNSSTSPELTRTPPSPPPIPTPDVADRVPVPAEGAKTLEQLYIEIEQKVGVPRKITEALVHIESPAVLNYTSAQIIQYSTPGNTIPGCGPNECSAAGPIQMSTGIDSYGSTTCSHCCYPKCLTKCYDVWTGYSTSVNTFGGYSHKPNACNLRDGLYGGAAKMKDDSGATSLNWTKDQVFRASARYYGSCDEGHRYARLGNRTYCEYVWWYYTNK